MTDKSLARLPEAIEKAVGRFIADFSVLEGWLGEIVLDLSGMKINAAEIVFSQLTFRGLVKICGAFIHEYANDPDVVHLFDSALPRIDRINEFRNRLVHSQLFGDHKNGDSAVWMQTKAHQKKGLISVIANLTEEEIAEHCDELGFLTRTLMDISDRLFAEQEVGQVSSEGAPSDEPST